MSTRDRTAALGAAVLRVALGTVFLAHSVLLKLFVYGLAGTAAFFASVGLPAWLAYLTFAVEAVGGVLLVLGLHVRATAVVLFPFMVGAAVTVHAANGWVFTAPGGGWEYPALLAVLCVVQALIGEGEPALRPAPTPMILGRLLGGARP